MSKASFSSSSSSFRVSSKENKSKCRDRIIELACSACCFCIFCPLSVVWCCAKLPCKFARNVIKWACCRSDKKVIAEYSSFSDIDPDDMPPCESPSYSFHPFCCACAKIRHRHGRCN
ncbi:hypothetical protein V6N13_070281 [Hibiscus sabdariffa]|uniref:Uncharacterized protein n=1 Tax=Hibiscus sabdariffa TaxID=183260 RepID=A0ABR2THH3_9ROSI